MVFDVFEIFFKSNAKQAGKEIKDVQEATTKAQDKINDADKAAEQLSSSLLKVGLQGLAAFASFEGIKNGIANAVNFNAELEKTAQLTGESAKQLAAYDNTFSQFGTGTGEFTDWFKGAATAVQLAHGNIQEIIPNIKSVSKELADMKAHGASAADMYQRLIARTQQYGGVTEGMKLGLLQDPTAFEKQLELQEDSLNVTKETTAEGLKLQGLWKQLGTDINTTFSLLQPLLLPIVYGLDLMVEAIHLIVDSVKLVLQYMIAIANTAADLATFNFSKIASEWSNDKIPATYADMVKVFKKNREQYNYDFGDSAPPLINAPATTSGAGSPVINAPATTGGRVPLGIRNNNPGNLRSWGGVPTSGGFAQFGSLQAGLSAEDRQLALYGQRGINTISGIVSKWAPSSENNTAAYIASVSKSTGFGSGQQLDLSDPAIRQKIANAINAQENGSSYGHLLGTASAAIGAADHSPLNSAPSVSHKQSSVNINQVIVNTQATDAKGIAGDIQKTLNEQLAYLVANSNDGLLA